MTSLGGPKCQHLSETGHPRAPGGLTIIPSITPEDSPGKGPNATGPGDAARAGCALAADGYRFPRNSDLTRPQDSSWTGVGG